MRRQADGDVDGSNVPCTTRAGAQAYFNVAGDDGTRAAAPHRRRRTRHAPTPAGFPQRRRATRRRAATTCAARCCSDELADRGEAARRGAQPRTRNGAPVPLPEEQANAEQVPRSASRGCARRCSCTSATSRRCKKELADARATLAAPGRGRGLAEAIASRIAAAAHRRRADAPRSLRETALLPVAGDASRRRYAGLELLATAVLLLDARRARHLRESRRREPVRALAQAARRAHAARSCSATAPALAAAIAQGGARAARRTPSRSSSSASAASRGCTSPARCRRSTTRDARAAARVPPHRPAAEDRARGAAARAAAGEPRADPQPRARDQESAGRHPRRGAAARARARPAAAASSTRR